MAPASASLSCCFLSRGVSGASNARLFVEPVCSEAALNRIGSFRTTYRHPSDVVVEETFFVELDEAAIRRPVGNRNVGNDYASFTSTHSFFLGRDYIERCAHVLAAAQCLRTSARRSITGRRGGTSVSRDDDQAGILSTRVCSAAGRGLVSARRVRKEKSQGDSDSGGAAICNGKHLHDILEMLDGEGGPSLAPPSCAPGPRTSSPPARSRTRR